MMIELKRISEWGCAPGTAWPHAAAAPNNPLGSLVACSPPCSSQGGAAGSNPDTQLPPAPSSGPPKVLVPAFLQVEIWGETAGAAGSKELFSAFWMG